MKQKTIFVTGAGRGIGRSIALELANAGYTVLASARSTKELEETRELSHGKVEVASVDVRDPKAIESWLATKPAGTQTWGLVTAAGIYGPIGKFWENSWEEWSAAMQINLDGTAHACRLFIQKVLREKEKAARIVLLSGGGATQPLPNFSSYCASKAAVVRFGETLAQEAKELGITVNSIAPGAVNTKLTDELIAAGPEKAGKDMYEKALKQKEGGGTDPSKAARLTEYLMREEAGNITGRLLSAVWDPWSNLHAREDLLNKAEIFTLRRIVPEDRGLKS